MHAPTRISYGEVPSGCRLNLPKLLISFGILAHDVPLHPLDPTAGTRQRNQHGVRHRQSIDYIWLCPCASRPRTQVWRRHSRQNRLGASRMPRGLRLMPSQAADRQSFGAKAQVDARSTGIPSASHEAVPLAAPILTSMRRHSCVRG